MQKLIPSTTGQNAAIKECADFADAGDPTAPSRGGSNENPFWGFQIYYDDSVNVAAWVCKAYYPAGSSASYFNVYKADASPVFGYQLVDP